MASGSWLSIPKGSHFSLANIPFGIITTPPSMKKHAAIAIGDHVLDLHEFANHKGFAELQDFPAAHLATFSQPSLNDFAALGQDVHARVRQYLQEVFAAESAFPGVLKDNNEAQCASLFRNDQIELHLPMKIGGYTDFFAGKNHAHNCGCIFRDPARALQPNYLQLPVAYNSRASSVVLSGTHIHRPLGQFLSTPGTAESSFGPSRRLDIELELGALLCKGNKLGEPINVNDAENNIFGFVLLNDWSARDLQAWEAIPLGPFNAKTFATSISPWIVLKGALEPFHTMGISNETKLHPYLQEVRKSNVYDIKLEVELKTSNGETATLSRTNGSNLVYSFPQMIAHHTIGGCPLEVGDLIGSGTISGVDPGTLGSFLEASEGGKRSFNVSPTIQRTFLEDGDRVTIRGWCGDDDLNTVGFDPPDVPSPVKHAWDFRKCFSIFHKSNCVAGSHVFCLGCDSLQKPHGFGFFLGSRERAEAVQHLPAMSTKTPEALLVAAAKVRSIAFLGGTPNSLSSWMVLCGGVIILFLILWLSDSTDVPFIQHLPSIPGLPIVGNLVQLGNEQPRRLAELSKKYGPVFQIRLGNKRFVVANSFQSIKQLWINNQSSLISRPTLHTFHKVLSSSQGFTIGTSPWDESCKRRRKAAAAALNRPSVVSYMPFADLESYVSIKELVQQLDDDSNTQVDLDPYPLFQRLALNLSLTLGYGFRIDGSVDNELLREIITVERGISTLRSTSNNWQDFVPLLRILSRRTNEASVLRHRRDVYLEHLLERLKDKIAMGTHMPCITGNILQDPECKLSHAEIKSICVTMIAGGLDTTPACILLGVAILSGPQGASLQVRLLDDIQKMYPDGDAWGRCLEEEKCEYMQAFCKEVLRFWTVIPMSLPRVSIKDIVWQGATIPAGTTFLMNAWAADYDPDHFKCPHEFNPERFLNVPEGSGTQHFAFGAGSRMCTGSHLAYREMYITFIRIIIALEVLPAKQPNERPILTGPLECNANPSGLSIEPKAFKIGFRVRDRDRLEKWFEQSVNATKHIER